MGNYGKKPSHRLTWLTIVEKLENIINKLSNDPTSSNPHPMSSHCQTSCPSAPRQWQRYHAIKAKKNVLPPATGGDTSKVTLSAKENTKKHLGPKAHQWLLTMLSICFMENKIPTVWRQSKIIAILKPWKDSSIPKNYRPISFLWHTYPLYRRIILNRIAPAIEQHQIKEQAGFRSGKSCTSQLINLTYWWWIRRGHDNWNSFWRPICCIWHGKPQTLDPETLQYHAWQPTM